MNIEAMSDRAILTEIGERLSRRRLNRNMTQEELAATSGVARRLIQRIEGGQGCSLENLIRILRALGLLGELDAFLPELGVSPLQLAKSKGHKRLRAAGRRGGHPLKRT